MCLVIANFMLFGAERKCHVRFAAVERAPDVTSDHREHSNYVWNSPQNRSDSQCLGPAALSAGPQPASHSAGKM